MLALLPGIGILLPDGAGTLRFGMDDDATQETLARLGRVRGEDVLEATWTYTVQWGDLELAAGAYGIDRPDLQPADLLKWGCRQPVGARLPGRGVHPAGTRSIRGTASMAGNTCRP
ncbi:hypothetical protein OG883_08320 [Streptomyces sp. NBC_01142]|uniref:hypothetical protein n=1 Tax=Streptomyces sp. NBC_01142 TaxID=2975865 RepID=UPI002250A0EF|nr:hypothetical protein [Streptomyces sp. NBC_01142]MCX4819909.1 hypothetical protein [Streptomyces sp. NBC_01142]